MATESCQLRSNVKKRRDADLETRIRADHPDELRLWLRMLACTTLVEKQVRTHLREEFATTLPRFDLMAQLDREPDGLRMNELSRRMMVSNGNVTGIARQLENEHLIERIAVDDDRRACLLRQTRLGRRRFREMAAAHESWIVSCLSGISAAEMKELYALLGKLKHSVPRVPPAP